MKKIVVTGGAGFIGSALVWKLNELGYDRIYIVDHLGESDKWRNLVGLKFLDYFDKEEFIDILVEENLLEDIAVIFHMGACTNTMEKDVDYLMFNNYLYTKVLAAYSIEKGIRFIYASSAATYGDGSRGFKDDESTLPELRPLNAYAFSKHLFDLWALQHGLLEHITGLKFFNVFGPNEYHKGEMRSVVIKTYEQIKEKGYVRLFKSHRPDFKDGEQRRDFIYIKDVVDIVACFMEHPELTGIYNVGTGKSRTFIELVNAVFNALGMKPKIEFFDMPESIRDRYQYFTEADISKLKGTPCYKGTMELEEAIYDYVKNYLVPQKYLAS